MLLLMICPLVCTVEDNRIVLWLMKYWMYWNMKILNYLPNFSTGIYWGFCRVGEDSTIFKTACSIGYNPYYGNKSKTVEPHLIADLNDERRHQSSCGETILGDFYDQSIRLSLVEYLRPELPFEGLEKLVAAIKKGQFLIFPFLMAWTIYCQEAHFAFYTFFHFSCVDNTNCEDISDAERLGDRKDPKVTNEKTWVASDYDPIPPWPRCF